LGAPDLGVEVVVRARLREHYAPHRRAAPFVERRAATGEGAADHLDAEALARSQVKGAVDVVEPPDVEVGRTPHAGLQGRLGGVGDGTGEHGHLGVVLERVDGPAVDVAPRL